MKDTDRAASAGRLPQPNLFHSHKEGFPKPVAPKVERSITQSQPWASKLILSRQVGQMAHPFTDRLIELIDRILHLHRGNKG